MIGNRVPITPVQFRAILPRPLQVQAMLNKLVNEMTKIGKDMVKDFDKTTRTWEGEKPEFVARILVNPPNAPNLNTFPRNLTIEVAPKDNGSVGARNWFFLNYGTKVRHAVMSKDFKPKTTVGLLSSKKGRGRMVFVSKKIKLPGIKPRKWNIALRRKWDTEFANRMRKVMYPVVVVSGHKALVGPHGGLF